MNNSPKLFSSFVIPILFIILGFYLIKKDNNIAVIIGYINILFWSALILFALYKFFIKKIKP
jgi:hypothetical protein